ncbi:MAG: RelA/SpoT AH/RIS domain-containing protein, partial [Thermohalobaculum sp.]
PFKWLRDLVERLEKGDEPQEFLEHVKLDMFTDQVFCFTPKGDVVGLPRGATPIDFAYAIHTNVGDRCAGALVDGRRVPLWTRLRNGQQVEVITAKGQTPSPHWEDMAQTGRAKSAIRRALRERLRAEQIGLGGDLAEQSFARAGRSGGKKAFAAAAAKLGFTSVKAMLVRLATGDVTGRQLVEAVYPSQPDGAISAPKEPASGMTPAKTIVRGIRRGAAIRFCTCCWPIPGDRIIGLARRGGVVVHAISCPMLAEFEDDLEHWHDLSWAPEASKKATNVARIDLTLANQPGTLGTVCSLIGEQQANIDNLDVTTRKPDFFLMSVDLEVRDVKHLSDILTALRAQSFVSQVERAITPPEREAEDAAEEQPRLPLGSSPAPQH